ncbi:hypothetical protein SLEP1_g30280 [Rubroshorea leprosula]|uniref:Uncharacterized protein n=1 Tax=Rubroshorea leprosula TaxID=152421 RepID=A0AAV5K7D9_9ROSI|nr:hypothetical protein SLEP1_g30280 [Rubroshorea leprosula]
MFVLETLRQQGFLEQWENSCPYDRVVVLNILSSSSSLIGVSEGQEGKRLEGKGGARFCGFVSPME